MLVKGAPRGIIAVRLENHRWPRRLSDLEYLVTVTLDIFCVIWWHQRHIRIGLVVYVLVPMWYQDICNHGNYIFQLAHIMCTLDAMFVGLRPVIQILRHVLARGWGRWLRYFTEAKPCQRPHPRAKIWHKIWMTGLNPDNDTIAFIPFKTHKSSDKNPRLLTIAGTIWFCRSRQCTPSLLWMRGPVAKDRWFMTSQYSIVDRTDNFESSVNASCQLIIIWIIRMPIMHID